MIPLPWLIIGWLVWTAVAGGVCYLKGGEHTRTAMLAAAAEASDRAVRRFNAYTREDIEAARQSAEREGRARLAARKIQHQFEMEVIHGQLLTLQARPGDPPAPPAGPVQLSDGAVRLFNDAIDEYNAAAQPAGSSTDPVPPDAIPRSRDPGRRPGAAHTAGQPLRLSRDLRTDAPGGGRLAAQAN